MNTSIRKVLLIEDNPGDLRLIELMFSEPEFKKFNLDCASTLAAGLKSLRKNHTDLILCDLGLPDCQGIETFKQLHTAAPHLPIIVLSGLDDEMVATMAVKLGAQDYLVKNQIDMILLKRAINYSFERKQIEMELKDHRDHLEELVAKRTKALKQSEEKFRTIASTAKDAIIMMDSEGTVSFWNKAAEKIFGYDANEVEGKDLHSLLAPTQYIENFKKGFTSFKKTKKGPLLDGTVELVSRRKDGETIPVEISVSPLEISGRLHAVAIVRDITERKNLQEELVRREKLALLGQMAGGVAHELRNPLGAIKNVAYFLNMTLDESDQESRDMLEVLKQEVSTSSRTIDALLNFSRLDGSSKTNVDLNRVIQRLLSKTKVPENIDVLDQTSKSISPIKADPDQLSQVFRNIIQNAIQAMPGGGKLTIKISKVDSRYIGITIKDTGIGISKEHLNQLFEPFFTTKAIGIGLGLSLSKQLIELNDGTIEVHSEEGKGSTFKVKFPFITKRN